MSERDADRDLDIEGSYKRALMDDGPWRLAEASITALKRYAVQARDERDQALAAAATERARAERVVRAVCDLVMAHEPRQVLLRWAEGREPLPILTKQEREFLASVQDYGDPYGLPRPESAAPPQPSAVEDADWQIRATLDELDRMCWESSLMMRSLQKYLKKLILAKLGSGEQQG